MAESDPGKAPLVRVIGQEIPYFIRISRAHRVPNWLLDRDPYYLETNMPSLFAAGDVRHNSVKRFASAVWEGAMAVAFAHRYLDEG